MSWRRSWRGACRPWEPRPGWTWAWGMTSTRRATRQRWTPGWPLCGPRCAPSDPCHLARMRCAPRNAAHTPACTGGRTAQAPRGCEAALGPWLTFLWTILRCMQTLPPGTTEVRPLYRLVHTPLYCPNGCNAVLALRPAGLQSNAGPPPCLSVDQPALQVPPAGLLPRWTKCMITSQNGKSWGPEQTKPFKSSLEKLLCATQPAPGDTATLLHPKYQVSDCEAAWSNGTEPAMPTLGLERAVATAGAFNQVEAAAAGFAGQSSNRAEGKSSHACTHPLLGAGNAH